MMWGYYGGANWGWGILMMLVMAAFWLLVVLGVFSLFRGRARQWSFPPNQVEGERPMEILKRRYARGEITREQFEEMRKVLTDERG